MSRLIAAPQLLAAAAADVAEIGSALSQASAAATEPIAELLPAAADEVSAASAGLYSHYARTYQAVLTQAIVFHDEVVRALAAAATAYAQLEAANTATLGTPAAPPAPGQPVALIMGYTGVATPVAKYLTSVNSAYIQPSFPGASPLGVFTPEQFWPVTPNLGNTLTFGQSVRMGVADLHTAITQQLNTGHPVVVFGYSQSSTVATQEMLALGALPADLQPDPSRLSFILTGDPNVPSGGILTRFPNFYIPLLDVAFTGVTPADSPYPTDVYTVQYEGIANVPRYSANLVADLNSFAGYFWGHDLYPLLTPTQVANAVPLPTSPGYTGNTHYYLILTQNLPLLEPIRQIPVIGPPLADLIQPDLRVIIDAGYGNYGAGGEYADITTPASWHDPINMPVFRANLALGAMQGRRAALIDLGLLPASDLPTSYPYVPSIDPGLTYNTGQPSTTWLSQLSGELGSILRRIPPIA